jgi:hypothetical protein
MRHLLAVGLVLAVVAPLSAQIEVEHMAYGPDPQFAGDPNQPNVAFTMGWSSWNGRSKPTLLGWGETSNGVAAGLFDKAELQQAIDDTVAMYGTWEAVIQVTQVNWVTTPIPLQFTPVVGSADVGSSTGYFAYQGDGSNDHPLLGDGRTSQTHRNAYGAIPAGVSGSTMWERRRAISRTPWWPVWVRARRLSASVRVGRRRWSGILTTRRGRSQSTPRTSLRTMSPAMRCCCSPVLRVTLV